MRGMGTITFDTMDGARKLREAGFDEKQAETVVRVLASAQEDLVSREHFDARMSLIDAKFDKLNWMIGFNLAFTMAILWKIFS